MTKVTSLRGLRIMKEIRLHGRGGHGLVKASHIAVRTAVEEGAYGQFIPFFGVERKGSPVFGFLRLSDEPIRRKMQVYEPDILLIFDDTLVTLPATYAGLKEGGTVIINSTRSLDQLAVPSQAATVALVDATSICLDAFGRNIPNTAMLGAFCKVTGLLDKDRLFDNIATAFGDANRVAAQNASDRVVCVKG